MSTSYGKAVLDDLAPAGRDLRRAIPGVYDGFRSLHSAAFAPGGALEVRHKELIALAIAVAKECDGCIASHARSAVKAGASKEECADMLGVTASQLAKLFGKVPAAWVAVNRLRGEAGLPPLK